MPDTGAGFAGDTGDYRNYCLTSFQEGLWSPEESESPAASLSPSEGGSLQGGFFNSSALIIPFAICKAEPGW